MSSILLCDALDAQLKSAKEELRRLAEISHA